MRLPTYFINHGAGPWPFMKDQLGGSHDALEASLRDIPRQLPQRPRAVLMVSAHWEEAGFAVMNHPKPPMLYDYGGFPEETYRVNYGAAGAPDVARQVQSALRDAGIGATLDDTRGFDHGCFVPMSVMYPQADMPVLQLSVQAGYDPAAHWAAGRALAPLREQGVLIVASGLSYHNMRPRPGSVAPDSLAFDNWLNDAVNNPDTRADQLLHWSQAPAARASPPREDHLIPLMVAAAAAEHEPATRFYHETGFLGAMVVSGFRFG